MVFFALVGLSLQKKNEKLNCSKVKTIKSSLHILASTVTDEHEQNTQQKQQERKHLHLDLTLSTS